jgi:hypothetical protein
MAPSPLRPVDLAMLLSSGKKSKGATSCENLTHLESRRMLRLAGDDEDAPSSGLSWPGLTEILSDGGLPRGVVELTAPGILGGATSFSFAAVRAGQARASAAWCAWIDPEATLHAPGIVAAGVDPLRMLVIRPQRAQLAHVTVKVVASGAFEVVVVDFDTIACTTSAVRSSHAEVSSARSPEVLVRKLALAAEPHGTTVLLLSDSNRPRSGVWPVALRLELSRPTRHDLSVRIAKDRRGRVGLAKFIHFQPVARLG